MAINQTQCTSFKLQLLQAVHDFTTDTFKIALYTSAASLGASTTVYTTTGEVVAAGYTAGGNTLTGVSVASSGTTAYVDFADATWTTSTTARGALIYNSSKADKAVAVLDFGADKTSTNTFTVQMPPNTASDAIIRIA
jgi:hypothetical protein